MWTVTLYCLKKTLSSLPSFLRNYWARILSFIFCIESLKQVFLMYQDIAQQNLVQYQSLQIFSELGFFATDLAASSLLFLLVSYWAYQMETAPTKEIVFLSFFKDKWSLLIIESLRSTASVISWSVLFIIPGLIKYFRLYFVPLIVAFHPSYQKGEVDALEESSRLLKGATAPIIATLLILSTLSSLAPPSLLNLSPSSLSQWLLGFLIFWSTHLLSPLFIYFFFQKLMTQRSDVHS